MNPYIQTAYEMGARTAQAMFAKTAKGEVITPLLGAVSPVGAGVAGGLTAPRGDRVAAGLGAGVGSLAGMYGGAFGGAGLGAGAGYGVHRLAKALGHDIDPEKATLIGALIGGGAGALGGGAYGAHKGRELVLKESSDQSDRGSVLVPALGAISPLGAGIAGAATAPKGERLVTGLSSGGGSLIGALTGAYGGGALGAGAGYGVHRLSKALGHELNKDKSIRNGALIGSLLGATAGGGLGAYTGRRVAQKEGSVKTARGEIPVTALGAIPGLGPTAAGMASEAYSPPGEEDVIAPMTSSRALKGQLIGGLGGAALGAGGLAIAKQLGLKTDFEPTHAALLGGLLGSGVGGAIGAHSGHRRGHEFVGALNDSIAERDQDLLRDTLQQYGYRIAPAY